MAVERFKCCENIEHLATDLKRLLAEKVLEVDFFKGALQQIESHDRKNSGSGRPTFTSTSGA